VIVAAIYLLWAYQQVFHGPIDAVNGAIKDLAWSERLVIAPLILLIVVLGVYPKPALDLITPAVDRLVARVDLATHTRPPHPHLTAVPTSTSAGTQRPHVPGRSGTVVSGTVVSGTATHGTPAGAAMRALVRPPRTVVTAAVLGAHQTHPGGST